MDPIIEQIFEGVAGIGAEFKTKTAVIFEAAVTEKAKTIAEAEVARISTEFDEKLATAITESHEALSTNVDAFLNAVIKEWAEENAVALDSKLKVQIAEKFIGDLKGLFQHNQVALPDADSTKLVEGLQSEVSAKQTLLDEAAVQLKEAQDKLQAIEFAAIFAEATKDLAETTRDRIKSLAEGLSYSDADSYKQKVGYLVEAFSTAKPATKTPEIVIEAATQVVTKPSTSSLIERTLALKH